MIVGLPTCALLHLLLQEIWRVLCRALLRLVIKHVPGGWVVAFT
jgi:hypothetical protein